MLQVLLVLLLHIWILESLGLHYYYIYFFNIFLNPLGFLGFNTRIIKFICFKIHQRSIPHQKMQEQYVDPKQIFLSQLTTKLPESKLESYRANKSQFGQWVNDNVYFMEKNYTMVLEGKNHYQSSDKIFLAINESLVYYQSEQKKLKHFSKGGILLKCFDIPQEVQDVQMISQSLIYVETYDQKHQRTIYQWNLINYQLRNRKCQKTLRRPKQKQQYFCVFANSKYLAINCYPKNSKAIQIYYKKCPLKLRMQLNKTYHYQIVERFECENRIDLKFVQLNQQSMVGWISKVETTKPYIPITVCTYSHENYQLRSYELPISKFKQPLQSAIISDIWEISKGIFYVQLLIETYYDDIKTWVPKQGQLKRYVDIVWEYTTGKCRKTYFSVIYQHSVQFIGNFRQLKLKSNWQMHEIFYVDMLSQEILLIQLSSKLMQNIGYLHYPSYLPYLHVEYTPIKQKNRSLRLNMKIKVIQKFSKSYQTLYAFFLLSLFEMENDNSNAISVNKNNEIYRDSKQNKKQFQIDDDLLYYAVNLIGEGLGEFRHQVLQKQQKDQ